MQRLEQHTGEMGLKNTAAAVRRWLRLSVTTRAAATVGLALMPRLFALPGTGWAVLIVLGLLAIEPVIWQTLMDWYYQVLEKRTTILLTKVSGEYGIPAADLPSAFYLALGESCRWYVLWALSGLAAAGVALATYAPVYTVAYVPLATVALLGILFSVFSSHGVKAAQASFLDASWAVVAEAERNTFLGRPRQPSNDWGKEAAPTLRRLSGTQMRASTVLSLLLRVLLPAIGVLCGNPVPFFLLASGLDGVFSIGLNMSTVLESNMHVERLRRMLDRIDASPFLGAEAWEKLRSGKTLKQLPVESPEKILLRSVSAGIGTRRIVENLDLVIERGQTLFLTGESGVGKTFLGRLLAMEVLPGNGNMSFVFPENRDIPAQPEFLSADQTHSLVKFLSLIDVENGQPVDAFLQNGNPTGFLELVRAFMPEFSDDDIHRPFNSFSTGQRRRIKLALMLGSAREVPFVVLDEPLAGLDAAVAQRVLETLRRMSRLQHRTFIVIDHERHYAENLFDKAYLLEDKGLTPMEDKNYLLRIVEEAEREHPRANKADSLPADATVPTEPSVGRALPVFVAHRARGGQCPENTAAAVLEAFEHGLEGVEIDVRMSPAGRLEVSHDPSMGPSESPGEDFEALLEIVDTRYPDREIFVDLKPDEEWQIVPGLAERVAESLSRHGRGRRSTVCSFYPSELLRVKRVCPELRTSYCLAFESTSRLLAGLDRLVVRVQSHQIDMLHLPSPSPKEDTAALAAQIRVRLPRLVFSTGLMPDGRGSVPQGMDYVSVDEFPSPTQVQKAHLERVLASYGDTSGTSLLDRINARPSYARILHKRCTPEELNRFVRLCLDCGIDLALVPWVLRNYSYYTILTVAPLLRHAEGKRLTSSAIRRIIHEEKESGDFFLLRAA